MSAGSVNLEKTNMSKIRDTLLIMLAILCIHGAAYCAQTTEPFELHVLNVGQGLSVMVEADNHYMLIDGGGRGTSSFVVSYLKQQGIEFLDCVVLSHYDEDHMAGVIGVLNVFPCNMVLLPSYEGSGELYQSLAVVALSNGCVIMHGKAGLEIPIGEASGKIIGPINSEYALDNDMSLCLKISYGNRRFLICGDAEQKSEADLVASETDLSADLYVVNHHGSNTSSTDVFLDSVLPTYAVISCGKDNGYGHPSTEVLQRLQDRGIIMYRTDEQGTVVAYSDGQNLWFNSEPSDQWTGSDSVLIPLELGDEENNNPISRIISDETELFQYVCNINTKKFHYPDCESVNQMKEENRLYTNLDREELVAEGYEPCGNCHP